MIRLSTAALLFLTLLVTPALAGGFKIEGTDLKTAKLVFDSSGIDRSTAEGTARGLLGVTVSIRSSNIEYQFEAIALGEMKRVLQPLLTSESYNDLLGSKEEKLRLGKELMKKATVESKIEFTDTSTKDGITTLRYVMELTMKVPCSSCAEKADPACKRCKGTQLRDRNRKVNGAVMVMQKDKLWLVTAMKKSCFRCEGTGKGNNGPKMAAPPHKCAGANCATCGGPPANVDCKGCSGTGMRDDNFFQGPRKAEGLPTLDATAPDMSSPEKAFASFARALQARQASQHALQSKLGEGFGAFVTFFCHPDHKPKQRTRKVSLSTYKALEVHKDGDDVARINYAVVREGAGPAAATKVAGKAELRKGGDGKWRVSQLSTPCWSCSYRRKSDPNFDCPKCKNTGFQKATYLP